MPKFIKEAPWYLSKDGQNKEEETILFHQRIEHDKRENIDKWYEKGYKRQSKAVTKFRKGACENCGAITHKTKECVERPRKVGAKWTERNIARDELDTTNQKVKLTYESKRDRWNGYNPDAYKKEVIEQWNLKESLVERANSSDSDEDEAFKKPAAHSHNLRNREDTAKYLRNLDPNSAPYDPKSRSMKQNPNPDNPDSEYKGDNFIKVSGDYLSHIQNEGFMVELNKKGLQANTLGMPSQFEMIQREYKQKKEQITTEKMQSILQKYGDQESLPAEMQEQLREELDQQQMHVLDDQIEKQREAMKQIENRHQQQEKVPIGEGRVVKRVRQSMIEPNKRQKTE